MNTEKTLAPFVNWFAIRPKTSGYLLTITLCLFVILISLQRYHILKEDQEKEMSIILNDIHENIDQSLKNCQVSIVSLALSINDEGVPQNFDEISKQLKESNHTISLVQLAPDGIIKYIYPMKGNEAAMNLNILDTPYLQKQANKSIKTKAIYFDGPLKLKQGGIGIVGRLPVYKKNKFWGFSAAVIKLDDLLKASKYNLIDKLKYDFQFSNIDPISHKEELYLSTKIDSNTNSYVSKKIPNSNWRVYLIEKNQSDLYIVILLRGLLGIVISILFGFFTSKLLKNPQELRNLLKEQEKKLLKNEMKFKTVFDQATVGFALIDAHTGNFKEVNDKYCSILGYTSEEIKGRSFTFFTHPDDIADCLQSIKKIEEGTIREYSTEKRYVSKSGKNIWVNLTVSPLWESNEKPTINIAFIKDITENKEAHTLIEKSEKRFKSIFDNSPLPMWEENFSEVKNHLIELDLMNKNPEIVLSYFNDNPEEVIKCISLVKIIDVNNECLKLHNINNKESFLEGLDKLIDPGSIDQVKEQLVAISQNAKEFSIDSRIKTLDGHYRDIHLQWNVTNGYEDSYKRVIVSTQDITNRKAAERAIQNSQLRTESIINTIDGIVWEYDSETSVCNFISKKVKSILGYSAKEWKSSPTFWEDHIHPEDLEFVLELTASATKQRTHIDYEYRIIAKNGEIKWIRDIVSFVFEDNKLISRGLMIDITIMKEAQASIEKSQARFKSLIDTVDGMVWEFDLEKMAFTFISKKVENILGYSVQEYMETPNFWEDHIVPEDREFALNSSGVINKKYTNHDYEYRMIAKNGEIVWIRDIVNFVYENNKPTMSRGLMIDITKMKEAEKNLNNSFHLVTEQNKRLLNFSYIVSHNLRSHTSNIESIIALIESAESEEERVQMMQLLKSVSNSLDETMNHLNEVVNINTNMSLIIKPLNLKEYISITKNTLSEQIYLTNTIIVTNIPDEVMINYNQAYLQSILYNLISNAIRYKQPDIAPIININWYKENGLDVVEISDNGIGIDLNKNGDKIFGMYKTFSNNTDSRGIGLYITKNQIEAMGGTITVESELNKGTTFKIYIK